MKNRFDKEAELRNKYGKLVTKAVKAQERANQYEQDVGKAVADEVKQMEKNGDRQGLIAMSVLMQSLFINHYVHEAIERVRVYQAIDHARKKQKAK